MASPKEFTIEVDGISFLVDVIVTENKCSFLFCKILDDQAHYFFMEQTQAGQWEIISRFMVPPYILAMEHIVTERISEEMMKN